jgi:two-component system CheB/CheR fusion protein
VNFSYGCLELASIMGDAANPGKSPRRHPPKGVLRKPARRARPNPKEPSTAPQRLKLAKVEQPSFPIVGIAGSADAYEALAQLLQSLSAKTDMAFVLVTLSSTEHKRVLARLLSDATPMPVTEARNGRPIKKNHLYVIPPIDRPIFPHFCAVAMF